MKLTDFPTSLAFDISWLCQKLNESLWQNDKTAGKVTNLEILQTSESSKRISALFEASIVDVEGHSHKQLFLGITVLPEKFQEELRLIRRIPKVQPHFGEAITLFPEASLILLAFPNDRHMQLFSEEMLQQWLKSHLSEVANGALNSQSGQVTDTKIDVLRYVPGKRYTVRCHVKMQADSQKPVEITFIAKQLKNIKKAQKLYENLRDLPAFWQQNGTNRVPQASASIQIPKPLALEKEKGIVFLEDIPGENLADSLANIDIPAIMPSVGELLANFHCAGRTVGRTISIQGELKKLRESIRLVTKRLPELRPRLKSFYEKMSAKQPDASEIECLLHGTFRLNHIFIHEQKLALLDFDSVCTGHPAYDIANFISALYYFEFQQRMTTTQRVDITRYFLEGYSANAKWPVSNDILLWHLANMLIKKQAHKYVKHLMQNREEQVIRLIHIAEKMCDKCHQPDAALMTNTAAYLPL